MNQGKGAIGGTISLFILPPLISLVYRYSDIGSIGPVVLIYSIICLPLLGAVYFQYLATRFSKVVAISGAILGAIVMATLVINYFMLVTHVFGIKDYHAM